MSEPNQHRLLQSLREALTQQWPDMAHVSMAPLKAKGLAHDHVRLLGTGCLARIPKQSQMQLGALENLNYQQACFERASSAGFAPRFQRLLLPFASLPRGALIVQEIEGRNAQLPQDLPLMARSMAAMHRLALPASTQRAPLVDSNDPLQAMWNEIQAQASYLPQADLAPGVAAQIHRELERFLDVCSAKSRPLKRLIAFDGHPGNFVIQHDANDQQKAYLVDLEKCRYSYPSFDLAHATLYTSTTWDLDSQTILRPEDVLSTYRMWASQVDTALALDAAQWHLPLRRAMWLWSITWCAKWRVASRAAAAPTQDGEDWSAQNLDARLANHVRSRVDHYLSAAGVACVSQEFDALAQHITSMSAASISA
jgi:thiamine kinase-like enzyme